MTCARCGQPSPAGQDRCPACSQAGAPLVEGSLAPDLARRPRAGVEPIRELPGKRRRERTWKDEVRERVGRRRASRGATPPAPPIDEPAVAARRDVAVSARALPAETEKQAAPATLARVHRAVVPLDRGPAARGVEAPVASAPLDEDAQSDDSGASHEAPQAPDVPLRRAELGRALELPLRSLEPEPSDAELPAPLLDDDWPLDPPRAESAARPVERPARPLERLQAALIDLGVLVGMAAAVVYFASRVAQVPARALAPAWPYLGAYLVFLGLFYAAYFTGTSGQTVGKLVMGLRVVDTSGNSPGYLRALARGALGAAGTALAGVGLLTVWFDPARRAVHDRVLHTRVVSVRGS